MRSCVLRTAWTADFQSIADDLLENGPAGLRNAGRTILCASAHSLRSAANVSLLTVPSLDFANSIRRCLCRLYDQRPHTGGRASINASTLCRGSGPGDD